MRCFLIGFVEWVKGSFKAGSRSEVGWWLLSERGGRETRIEFSGGVRGLK